MPPTDNRGELTRRLVGGGTWALSARFASVGLIFTLNALITRLLPPQEAGGYYLALSVATFTASVAQLGLQQAAVQLIAEALGRGAIARAKAIAWISLRLATGGAVAVALIIMVAWRPIAIGLFSSKMMAGASGSLAFWIAGLTLQGVCTRIFLGFQNLKVSSLLESAAGNGICLILFLILLRMRGRSSFGSLIHLSALAAILTAIVAAGLLLRALQTVPGLEPSVSHGEVVRAAWPTFVFVAAARFFDQAFFWVAGILLPGADLALFAICWRVATLISLPLLILDAFLPPFIAELFAQRREIEMQSILRSTATVVGVPAFVLLLLISFFPSSVLGYAFGEYYRRGASILVILALGQAVSAWSGASGITLAMIGQQRLTLVVVVVCGTLAVPLSVLAGRRYGIHGIAAVGSIWAAVQSLGLVFAVRMIAQVWTPIDFRLFAKVKFLKHPLQTWLALRPNDF